MADHPPHTSPDAHFLLQLLACPCLPYVIPHRHPFPSWNIKESYRSLIFNRILTNEKRKYSTKINRCTLFSGFLFLSLFIKTRNILYGFITWRRTTRINIHMKWISFTYLYCSIGLFISFTFRYALFYVKHHTFPDGKISFIGNVLETSHFRWNDMF